MGFGPLKLSSVQLFAHFSYASEVKRRPFWSGGYASWSHCLRVGAEGRSHGFSSFSLVSASTSLVVALWISGLPSASHVKLRSTSVECLRRLRLPRNRSVAESALAVLLLAVPEACFDLFWVGSAGDDPAGEADRGLVVAGL